jgi:RimJ/RimL family protein N-acetyltransferase
LRLAPTAFTSSFETALTLPDAFFEERASFVANNFIVGAFDEVGLVGTAGGYADPERKRAHIGYVVGMWVEPSHRHRGIARELLDRVVQQLRSLPNIATIQLAVKAGNDSAQRLYESYGFTAWGREPMALAHDGRYYDEISLSLPARPP